MEVTMTDLEGKALSQFDRLVELGDLLWQENAPRAVNFEPFNVRIDDITI
jgi:hypothetical protein